VDDDASSRSCRVGVGYIAREIYAALLAGQLYADAEELDEVRSGAIDQSRDLTAELLTSPSRIFQRRAFEWKELTTITDLASASQAELRHGIRTRRGRWAHGGLASTVALAVVRIGLFEVVARADERFQPGAKASRSRPTPLKCSWGPCHTLRPVAASTRARGTLMLRERSHSPSALACASRRRVEVAPVPSNPWRTKFTAPRLGSS
jgi:hypothetical protein